jgi:hypothetical protein
MTIVEAFRPLRLMTFALVDDSGRLVAEADPARFDGWYSCGLFEFTTA